jgi:hypothetical protein
MSTSLCNYASLSIPVPTFDPIAILKALLQALGLHIPQMPTIPLPAPFCPLD